MNHAQSKLAPVTWILWPLLLLEVFVLFQWFGHVFTDSGNASIFQWTAAVWLSAVRETEHGWLVFGVAIALFVWNLRRTPVAHNRRQPGAGLLLLGAGLAVHLLGYVATQTRISYLGLLLCLTGLAYLIGGRRWGHSAAFPAAFMVFALPLGFLESAIGFPLRQAVIWLVTGTAHLLGMDIWREGTLLYSPDGGYQYDVAPACSGIRSLVSLAALSLVLGYVSFRSWWRRLLLLVLAAPFALVGNYLRILAIVLAAEWMGQRAGIAVHDYSGILIFLVALGLAFAAVRLLDTYLPEKPRTTAAPPENWPQSMRAAPSGIQHALYGLLAVFLVIALIAAVREYRPEPRSGIRVNAGGTNPVALPAFLGSAWLGRPAPISEQEREILPPDTGFARMVYQSTDNPARRVYVSIVLSGRDRSSIHRPEICLAGQGWNEHDRTRHLFPVEGIQGGGIEATLIDLSRPLPPSVGQEARTMESLFAYWFVGPDSLHATNAGRLWKSARERLFGLQSHRWGFVVVQGFVGAEGRAATLREMENVVRATAPVFQTTGFSYNPGEQKSAIPKNTLR